MAAAGGKRRAGTMIEAERASLGERLHRMDPRSHRHRRQGRRAATTRDTHRCREMRWRQAQGGGGGLGGKRDAGREATRSRTQHPDRDLSPLLCGALAALLPGFRPESEEWVTCGRLGKANVCGRQSLSSQLRTGSVLLLVRHTPSLVCFRPPPLPLFRQLHLP